MADAGYSYSQIGSGRVIFGLFNANAYYQAARVDHHRCVGIGRVQQPVASQRPLVWGQYDSTGRADVGLDTGPGAANRR